MNESSHGEISMLARIFELPVPSLKSVSQWYFLSRFFFFSRLDVLKIQFLVNIGFKHFLCSLTYSHIANMWLTEIFSVIIPNTRLVEVTF